MRSELTSALMMVAVICSGCSGNTPSSSAPRAEDVIAAELQQVLNQSKQEVFNRLHPVGTATGAVVHDVAITWKRGEATNRLQDVQAFTVRYTIYWRGPVTQDGYTKVSETFDNETQRYTSGEILATNGITNRDAGQAIGAMLLNCLNNN